MKDFIVIRDCGQIKTGTKVRFLKFLPAPRPELEGAIVNVDNQMKWIRWNALQEIK